MWIAETIDLDNHDLVVKFMKNQSDKIKKLEKENEQLKQRNDNQYKQLQHLWSLMEEKDWRTLTDMVEQMKKDEEQLQREWGLYSGDLND